MKPEYVCQKSIVGSIVNLDSRSDDFFALDRKMDMKNIFKRKVTNVISIK
jgi:hypothetical protein